MTETQKKISLAYLLIFVVFFLSGFAGLIYESIWTHYLKLYLGHAAYAQTIVLMTFMGGMAVGSWLVAKRISNVKSLLIKYAIVEGIIGVLALLFHSEYLLVTEFSYNHILSNIDSSLGIETVKYIIAFLLVFPQTVLLGATFPLMSNGMLRIFNVDSGKVIANLYFVNSLGAAIGVLASGFYLIDKAGLPGTILTAGLINIFVCIVVYFIAKSTEEVEFKPQQLSRSESSFDNTSLLYVVAAITGVASFIYEIVWIRMLSLVMGASTHSFEIMLFVFIFGLSIGSRFIKNRIALIDNKFRFLGMVQIIMGCLALLSLTFYSSLFELMSFIMESIYKTEDTYSIFNLTLVIFSMLTMLPATICAGMTLPLISTILLSSKDGERSIGKVYAWNTIGAIIGIVVTVHVLLPLLGTKYSLLMGCLLDAILGLFLIYKSKREWFKPLFAISGVVFVVILNISHINPEYTAFGPFRGIGLKKDIDILYQKDGKTASVSVFMNGTYQSISTNGKIDAGVETDPNKPPAYDQYTMSLLGMIPMMYKPFAENVAVIGMGSGISSHTLLTNPFHKTVTTIEIESAMVEGAKYFNERSENVFLDKRSEIVIEDAKTYFVNSHKTFDIIVSEPSNPWVSGVSSVFSDEFYRKAKKHLTDDGIFVQWLHVYELNDDLLTSILKAIAANFAHYDLYIANAGDLVLVASEKNPLKINEESKQLWTIDKFKNEAELIYIDSLDKLSMHFLTNQNVINQLIRFNRTSMNSDFFPILDLNAVRSRFKNETAHFIHRVVFSNHPLLEVVWKEGNNYRFVDGGSALKNIRDSFYIKPIIYHDELFSSNVDLSGINVHREVTNLHYLFDSNVRCAAVEDLNQAWISAFYELMNFTVAYFKPEYINGISTALAQLSCDNENKVYLELIDFYSAYGNRDWLRLIEVSERLINNDEIQESFELNYFILISRVLAYIAVGDLKLAYDEFSRIEYTLNEDINIEALIIYFKHFGFDKHKSEQQ